MFFILSLYLYGSYGTLNKIKIKKMKNSNYTIGKQTRLLRLVKQCLKPSAPPEIMV